MIELRTHAEGVVLPVRGLPGASRSGVRGEQRGALKVAVTQVAEKGKANAAIVEVLADALALKRSQIELLAGDTHRDKQFLIRGLTLAELSDRLSKL